MFNQKHTEYFKSHETPFYFYDTQLLKETLSALKKSIPENYIIHYALKANPHPTILKLIKHAGLGADCVSGNEVKRASECGFKNTEIGLAGV